MCFMHEYAFPNGPEVADLDQTLCHLIQESLNSFSCDQQTTMTASEFLEEYSAEHATFCENNEELVTSVLAGTSPDAVQIYETALAEAFFVLQAQQDEDDRRRLFINFGGIGNWLAGAFKAFMALFVTFMFLFAIWGMSDFGRRALTASDSATSLVINIDDVLTECLHGVNDYNSFLCNLPVNDFVALFNTGVCATVGGLLCVISQEDVLALGNGN